MIDIAKEKPIPCDELLSRYPDHVPGRGGRPVHHVTIEMWRRRGVQGVTLETVMCDGRRCTSLEALGRFYEAVSQATDRHERGGPANAAPAPVQPRTKREQGRDVHKAVKELVKRRA